MAAILGLNATTYFADSIGTPVWTDDIGPIRDETLNLEKALADITDRRAKGWRLQVGTLKEATVDAELIYDPADADFQKFSDAFFDDTQLVMAFMDGDVSVAGTYNGLIGAFVVTTFNQTRSLEEALTMAVTMTPVLEDTTDEPPQWLQVTVP